MSNEILVSIMANVAALDEFTTLLASPRISPIDELKIRTEIQCVAGNIIFFDQLVSKMSL